MKKSTSQRQKQKQSVKQVVNVRIGEIKHKKSKRKRARRQPSAEAIDMANYLTPQQMPIVAYQTGYGSFPVSQGNAFSYQPTPQLTSPTPATTFPTSTQPQWEDTGLVGSGGAAVILPQPTKKEQLEEFVQPVAKAMPSFESSQIGIGDNSTDFGAADWGIPQLAPLSEEWGIPPVLPTAVEEQSPQPKTKPGKRGTSKKDLAQLYFEKYGRRPPSRMTRGQLMVEVFKG
jgi:hypothetical protein